MTDIQMKISELCNCSKCDKKDTCNYKDKYQRLPREIYKGALGLCHKLKNERW